MRAEIGSLPEQAGQQGREADADLQHLHGAVEEQIQAFSSPQRHRRLTGAQHPAHGAQVFSRPVGVEGWREIIPQGMRPALVVDDPDRHPITGGVDVKQPAEERGHVYLFCRGDSCRLAPASS